MTDELLTEADFDRFTYYVCDDCGHVETRQAVVEPPSGCENCRNCHSFWTTDDLDMAEVESADIVRRRDEGRRREH